MALMKIRNPGIALVSQLLVCIATVFLIDLLISDDSVASALFQSVFTALFAVGCLWWLARRARS